MKVAIVHYWLVGMRGGEKVVEALSDMYPSADIFTHVVDPTAISSKLKRHRIVTTFISSLPFAKRAYKTYLPLMPVALENLDLRGYDLIISSESGPAKGIVPPPEAAHVCYCHSPMRYIWNMYPEYRASAGLLARLSMPWLTHYLRGWDESSAARVDRFVANSANVARRIRKYYRRDSNVVHPPVSFESFAPVPPSEVGDYYLMVGELVAYKRPNLAVEAFNASGKPLIVIGGGEMHSELKRIARANVKVLGPQPFDTLRHHYASCRALIFPGEEDFGIVPLEAMASGRPIVAFRRGGALETVAEGKTGVFFNEQTIASLNAAVEHLDTLDLDPAAIRRHAHAFDVDRFKREMREIIDQTLRENYRQTPIKTIVPNRVTADGRLAERRTLATALANADTSP